MQQVNKNKQQLKLSKRKENKKSSTKDLGRESSEKESPPISIPEKYDYPKIQIKKWPGRTKGKNRITERERIGNEPTSTPTPATYYLNPREQRKRATTTTTATVSKQRTNTQLSGPPTVTEPKEPLDMKFWRPPSTTEGLMNIRIPIPSPSNSSKSGISVASSMGSNLDKFVNKKGEGEEYKGDVCEGNNISGNDIYCGPGYELKNEHREVRISIVPEENVQGEEWGHSPPQRDTRDPSISRDRDRDRDRERDRDRDRHKDTTHRDTSNRDTIHKIQETHHMKVKPLSLFPTQEYAPSTLHFTTGLNKGTATAKLFYVSHHNMRARVRRAFSTWKFAMLCHNQEEVVLYSTVHQVMDIGEELIDHQGTDATIANGLRNIFRFHCRRVTSSFYTWKNYSLFVKNINPELFTQTPGPTEEGYFSFGGDLNQLNHPGDPLEINSGEASEGNIMEESMVTHNRARVSGFNAKQEEGIKAINVSQGGQFGYPDNWCRISRFGGLGVGCRLIKALFGDRLRRGFGGIQGFAASSRGGQFLRGRADMHRLMFALDRISRGALGTYWGAWRGRVFGYNRYICTLLKGKKSGMRQIFQRYNKYTKSQQNIYFHKWRLKTEEMKSILYFKKSEVLEQELGEALKELEKVKINSRLESKKVKELTKVTEIMEEQLLTGHPDRDQINNKPSYLEDPYIYPPGISKNGKFGKVFQSENIEDDIEMKIEGVINTHGNKIYHLVQNSKRNMNLQQTAQHPIDNSNSKLLNVIKSICFQIVLDVVNEPMITPKLQNPS